MPVSSALVDRLRRMTAVSESQYTIVGTEFWSADDLQTVLEGRVCARLVQVEIELLPSVSTGGLLEFINGQVVVPGVLDTEGAIVTSFDGPVIEDATVHDDGRIEFATTQATTVPLLSCLCYDLNGAAADVLTDWASAVKQGYDISTDGQSLKRSQRHAQLLEQAKAFRARAVSGSVQLRRFDLARHDRGATRTGAAIAAFERLGRW